MGKMTHIDDKGKARMVNIGEKPVTKRTAVASATVVMKKQTFGKVLDGEVPKGDVFAAARIAGIMGAKKTPELIPLCHPLSIDSVEIDINPDEKNSSFIVTATVSCTGKTGVEMEALTAVSTAALTMYDMCKSLDKSIEITETHLLKKTGGKSGEFVRK